MFDNISSGAKQVLLNLYQEYINRIKSGQDIESAVVFGSSLDIQHTFFPNETPKNVDHWCKELSRETYLHCFFADNIAYTVTLTDKAICECQNRFQGTLVEIAKFLSNFIP